jgi:hypothetical protein
MSLISPFYPLQEISVDFAKRLLYWADHGFPELGDIAGMGIGATTEKVFQNPQFTVNPHAVAQGVWEGSGKTVAPNGGVMRTSILGIPKVCMKGFRKEEGS